MYRLLFPRTLWGYLQKSSQTFPNISPEISTVQFSDKYDVCTSACALYMRGSRLADPCLLQIFSNTVDRSLQWALLRWWWFCSLWGLQNMIMFIMLNCLLDFVPRRLPFSRCAALGIIIASCLQSRHCRYFLIVLVNSMLPFSSSRRDRNKKACLCDTHSLYLGK